MRTRSVLPINMLALMLALVLALGVSGCGAAEPGVDAGVETSTGADTESGTEAGPAEEEDDLEYLEGSWNLTTALTDIDNAMMTMAADQPGAVWDSVTIEDSTVTFTSYDSPDSTVKHDYTGTIEAGNGGWVLDAAASYTDETGATWTSTIEVHGTRVGDDSFGGYMVGSIDADSEGHLYQATWDITGMRR
ncbi:MAG: hypothetical protein JXP37_04415 [Coriobacteriia bacterium]|nr:hypothetical protein [Coriobacteriia bacterium]